MRTPVPAHYLLFRIVLVLVLLGALAEAVWWLTQPAVLAQIRQFLGV